MLRCFMGVLILFVFNAGARAADSPYYQCEVENVNSTYTVQKDVSLANIGDVVGTYNVGGVIKSCIKSFARRLDINLTSQPLDPLSGGNLEFCQTTISGMGLWGAGTASTGRRNCSFAYSNGAGNGGPGVGTVLLLDSEFPYTFRNFFIVRKTGSIAPGIHVLDIVNPVIDIVTYSDEGLIRNIQQEPINGSEEIIGTNCSLATTAVPVDFGEATLNATQTFTVSFDSCTDRDDALNYNNAVSLEFSSGQSIKPDGSALLNCTDVDCAKGIQIELKNDRGMPINLMNFYKLSNSDPTIGVDRLDYTFSAQLKANPSEELSAGKIDTQLIFEATIE